jgi:hypothetical protein
MEGAFNPVPSITHKLRKANPRVFVYFAEKVLAINQLQMAPPKIKKGQPSVFEFNFLGFCDRTYNVRLTQTFRILKTLRNPTSCAWTRNNKFGFREIK